MKLENIFKKQKTPIYEDFSPSQGSPVTPASSDKADIDNFLSANANNEIVFSPQLDTVDIELAHFILCKLASDLAYVPSPLVLQAIRTINALVSLGRAQMRLDTELGAVRMI